ncbi:TPA: hypothetical protein NPP60_004945 [Klebsiella variicola subsp. variicola]|nr:hypothetical protein [Klebsiella variicola subsp. variicola]
MKDLLNTHVKWTMETVLDGKSRTPFTATMTPEDTFGRIRMDIEIDDRAVGFVLSTLDAIRESIIERHNPDYARDSAANDTNEIELANGFDPSMLAGLNLPEDMGEDARNAIAAMLGGLADKLGGKAPRVEVINASSDPARAAEILKMSEDGKGVVFGMDGTKGEEARTAIRKHVNRMLGRALSNPPEEMKEAIAKMLSSSGIVRHAEYEEYQLHQHDDGTVCAAIDGDKQADVMPILQDLARRFGIAVNTNDGSRRTEEDLGKEVIDFFAQIPTSKAALH